MASSTIIASSFFNNTSTAYIVPENRFNNSVSLREKTWRSYVGGDPAFRSSSDTPFKVSFKSIQVEGYSPNNPPPIGIQVIGFNNFIL